MDWCNIDCFANCLCSTLDSHADIQVSFRVFNKNKYELSEPELQWFPDLHVEPISQTKCYFVTCSYTTLHLDCRLIMYDISSESSLDFPLQTIVLIMLAILLNPTDLEGS